MSTFNLFQMSQFFGFGHGMVHAQPAVLKFKRNFLLVHNICGTKMNTNQDHKFVCKKKTNEILIYVISRELPEVEPVEDGWVDLPVEESESLDTWNFLSGSENTKLLCDDVGIFDHLEEILHLKLQ